MGVEQAEQSVGEQGDAGAVRLGEGLFERGLERRGEPAAADGDRLGHGPRQQGEGLGQDAPRRGAGPGAVAQIGLGHGGEAGGGFGLARFVARVAARDRIMGAEHGLVERVHGLGEDGGEQAGPVRIGAAQPGLGAAHLPGEAGERDRGHPAAGEEVEGGGADLRLPLAPGGGDGGGAGGLAVLAPLGLGDVEALAVALDEGKVPGPLGLAPRDGGCGGRGDGAGVGGGHG